jgi:predicted nucleic acid-binding protein
MFKRNRLTLHEALTAVAIYQQIPIRFIEIELEETLKIADELGIYAYDACLLRSAIKYNLPLFTLDQGLKMQAERAGVKVIEVGQ